MKRATLIMLGVLLSLSWLAAQDAMIPADGHRKADPSHNWRSATPFTRDAPGYQFLVAPTSIMTSYFDYTPGGYSGTPMHLMNNGCLYAVFHATQTAASTRRQYYAYIHPDGSSEVNLIGDTSVFEGYAGIDLDPETQDPLYTWHGSFDTDSEYECRFAFDAFHVVPGPGMLSEPFNLIDNGSWSGEYQPPNEDDDFDWPLLHISKAPSYDVDGKRRVYVMANNSVGHSPGEEPSENLLIAWADYDTADLEAQAFADLDWHYETIPQMDDWNAGNVWIRPFHSEAVTDDGRIAVIGYLVGDGVENDDPNLFVLTNDNFAEGAWNLHTYDARLPVTPPDSLFEHAGPYYFNFTNSGHFTAQWDGLGRVHFPAVYSLCAPDDSTSETYWPWLSCAKEVIWDSNTEQFITYDLWPRGAHPEDGQPMLPWDIDEDGVTDVDDDGAVVLTDDWPLFYWDEDDGFADNLTKLASSPEHNLMAAVWSNSIKARYFNSANYEEYADWADVPEIFISISTDAGSNWTEPIRLNSIETPELAGMIPEYVYLADTIEYLGNNQIKLHLLFYDDNSYGYYGDGDGSNAGGTICYASMIVNVDSAISNPVKAPARIAVTNSPNPFNPVTAITFSLPAAGKASVDVFNLRGQLVKNLLDERMSAGEHTATWNGSDDRGANCASGIYFTRVRVGNDIQYHKMTLLK
jgi:hypothetical protein